MHNASKVTITIIVVVLEQLASHLDRAVSAIGRKPLKVFVQVNTSGETCESINAQLLKFLLKKNLKIQSRLKLLVLHYLQKILY